VHRKGSLTNHPIKIGIRCPEGSTLDPFTDATEQTKTLI
jgi:hypothetical protein